jgi:asparagine synthase (glutamine-hydrolysing)
MCGINGIVSFRESSIISLNKRIEKMNASMLYRGPDNNEVFIGQNFALGHLRLSILDLDPRSNQPMRYKNHCLVFNGEIFNYKKIKEELEFEFSTDSDTEVVLVSIVEKGIDWFLSRANGFFAIAIINEDNGELILARDRFGIKPLVYSKINDTVIFSSEIKGLLESGLVEAEFRSDKVEEYLSYRFILEPDTFFKGVHQIESGTYHIYDNQGCKVEIKYWDVPNTKEFSIENEEDLIRELSDKVISAVRDWAITDVPLGAFLSGGVDSSLTSAILSKDIEGLKTYTIGYSEDGYNEFEFASKVSTHIGSEHIELNDDLNSYYENWDKLIALKDAPLSVPNEVPLAVLCDELRKDIIVVISGEGADELFGGYGKIFRLPYELSKNDVSQNIFDAFIHEYSYISKDFLNKHFIKQSHSFEDKVKYVLENSRDNEDFMYRVFHSIHIKGLLARVDMTSMQASIEARPPFLNHELVEYVYENIPNSLKLKWKDSKPPKTLTPQDYSEIYDIPKYPLKKVAEEFIPKDIVYRRKMGFPVPLNDWFNELLNELDLKSKVFEGILTSSESNKNFLADLRKESRFGQSLWMLLNLQKFHNQYFTKSWVW